MDIRLDITQKPLPGYPQQVGAMVAKLEKIYGQYCNLVKEERELLEQLAEEGYAYEEKLSLTGCL